MIGSFVAAGTRRTPFTVARIPLETGGRSPDATMAVDTGVDVRGLVDALETAGSMRDARVCTGALFALPFLEPFFEAPFLEALFLVEEAIRGDRVGGVRLFLKIRRTNLIA